MSAQGIHGIIAKPGFLDKPIPLLCRIISIDSILFFALVVLAVVTRFYDLGARALSHDESIHIYFSYLFSQGAGYFHTPLSHGPLQFHILAFLFFLFGSSDFLGRLSHAIASILTILMIWNWRKYLGRTGAILSALMMVISPYMLYYGRYARNEAFVGLFGILTLYALLRYLETDRNRYLTLLTVATALHFTVKETAFIYVAQAMVFLCILLFFRLWRLPSNSETVNQRFPVIMYCGISLVCLSIGLSLFRRAPPLVVAPALLESSIFPNYDIFWFISLALGSIGSILLLGSLGLMATKFGWKNIKQEPAFRMLILLGTLVLPQLAAFPITWLGWDPLIYQFTWPGWDLSAIFSQGPAKTAAVFLALSFLSIVIGLAFLGKNWVIQAALFWGIYTLFYTSLFSNPSGFFTGSIGSLGYWLAQQGVNRGNQPWYYYLLIQIPMYEFLPALGVLFSAIYELRYRVTRTINACGQSGRGQRNAPVFYFLMYWVLSSLVAFSLAGEKMPWLTVHIALPMILLAGRGIGQHVRQIDWCVLSQALSSRKFMSHIKSGVIIKISFLALFLVLTILTARTSIRAAFRNPGNAMEYLVYAHGAEGIKNTMNILDSISQNAGIADDELVIAYDGMGETQGVSWPLKWYMRNYLGAHPYSAVDRAILDSDIIIADPQSYTVVHSHTNKNYYELNTIRMVWPNQDYFSLTSDRLLEIIHKRDLLLAIFAVWYNRDFSLYTDATGMNGFNLADWNPSDGMRVYIRGDLAARVWNFYINPSP